MRAISRLSVHLVALVAAILAVEHAVVAATASAPTGKSAPRVALDDEASRAFGARERVARAAIVAKRATVSEQEARRESRAGFGTVTDSQAVELVRSRTVPAGKLGAFRTDRVDGGKVLRFVGEHAAQVENEDGSRVMVASDVPLRTTDRDGVLSPIDLSLRPDGNVVRLENALVRARLPRTLGSPIELVDAGIVVRPSANRRDVAAETVGGALVYPNTDIDADTIVKPLARGVEVSWAVRSPRAGETYRFEVASAEGDGKLELVALDRGAGVGVLLDGKPVAVIPAAIAVDADGEPVEASTSVDGRNVVVTVRHRDRDVKYPLYVDPPVVDTRNWNNGTSSNFLGWVFMTNPSNYFAGSLAPQNQVYPQNWGAGLWVAGYMGLNYAAFSYGQWVFTAPRESFISRVDLSLARHQPANTWYVGGLYNLRGGAWEPALNSGYGGPGTAGPYYQSGPMYGGTLTSCATASCDDSVGSDGNAVVMALQVHTAGTRANYPFAYAGGATVRINDRNNPSTAVMGGNMPSGWFNGDYTVTSRLSDPGTGPWFNRLSFRPSGGSATMVDEDNGGSPCFGHACPTSVDTTVSANASVIQQGVGQFELTGFDWVHRQSNTVTWPVKVDAVEPDLVVDGVPGGGVLDEDAVLQIGADDGKGAPYLTSGTQGLIVSIADPDGQNAQVLLQDGDSEPENGTKDATVTVPYASQALTNRVLTVAAIDGATNQEIQTFPLRVAPARLVSPSQGFKVPKLVPLQVDNARSGVTGVRFEYRLGAAGTWAAVPPANVKNGTATVPSWPVAVSDGASPVLWWDAASTPGIAVGAGVEVRAILTGSGGDVGASRSAAGLIDPTAIGRQYASQEMGPGTVTLSNGNFALDEIDVNIEAPGSDLSVQRVYNSRRSTEPGPLGPGWELATPVLAAGDAYLGLYKVPETSPGAGDAYVYVVQPDWSLIPFQQAGSGFASPAGFRHLKLRYASGPNEYTLADSEGNETLFKQPAGSQGYKPVSVTLAGANAREVRWVYETVGGITRPTMAIAPSPAGVMCTTTSLPAGCRALELVYSTTTSASGTAEANWGTHAGRLARVNLIASPGGTGTPTSTPVAEYLYDSTGALRSTWDPRISPALKEKYAYSSGVLSQVTPPGERPWSLSYTTTASDAGAGRLWKVQRDALPSGTATWTLAYDVPVSGSGAPHQMAAGDVAAWDQADVPASATAVFPPTQVPAQPPTSFSDATIFYLNANALAVNVARPGGRISATEYDAHRNAIRELSAQNRVDALAGGGDTAARARELDTRRTFDTTGERLLKELSPTHEVRLPDGSVTDARRETTSTYNEGRPVNTEIYNLVTSTTTGARLANGTLTDTRRTELKYDGQSNLGWELRQPTRQIIDPAGLAITTTTLYDQRTGQPVEHRQPSDPTGTTAATTKTALYTPAAHPEFAACADKPGWAGMPCRIAPAAQPAGALPQIPTKRIEYNQLLQPTLLSETTPSQGTLRLSSTSYDAAGRPTGEQVTATAGSAVSDQTTTYHASTGRLATTSAGGQTISRTYDDLGRLSSYTDASGEQTTYGYDIKDRLVTTTDSKATRTQTYDARDNVESVVDTQVPGAFVGVYNHDDELLQQIYPNGVAATYYINALGDPWFVMYTRTVGCASDCHILAGSGYRTVHGQVAQSAMFGSMQTLYDKAGRISEVRDNWGTCETRKYTYDPNSNRTGLRTVPPLGGGGCDTTGTGNLVSHTHDTADRLTDTGIVYDTLGRITTLPAGLAGGQALTTSYFTNDLVKETSQNGQVTIYRLDPARRIIPQLSDGSAAYRYGDDTDNPAWVRTNTTGAYTRSVAGVDGLLAAIYDSSTSSATLQYANLHGDITGHATTSSAQAASFTHLQDSSEFGIPRASTNTPLSWLGSHERPKVTATGTTLMGVRVYQPQLGRFLQVDPVFGGSANPYEYVSQDPLNMVDLDGRVQCPTKKRGGCANHPTKRPSSGRKRPTGKGRSGRDRLVWLVCAGAGNPWNPLKWISVPAWAGCGALGLRELNKK